MFNEQQVVLRTFETDTARALSTADSRARAFVDELRSQVFQSKTQKSTEQERAEQRMIQKLDEIKRSVDGYVKYLIKNNKTKYLLLCISRNDMKNVLKMLYVNLNEKIYL